MEMVIELLTVPGCANEDAAIELITTAIADTGVRATFGRTTVSSEEQAQERRFVGSPTILVNGTDPFERGDEQPALACRLYPTPAGLRGVPALQDLREALKRAAAG